jgi:hypothetical protein
MIASMSRPLRSGVVIPGLTSSAASRCQATGLAAIYFLDGLDRQR